MECKACEEIKEYNVLLDDIKEKNIRLRKTREVIPIALGELSEIILIKDIQHLREFHCTCKGEDQCQK